MPKDVEDALTICRSFQFVLLKLRYENSRLAEYILHLHSTALVSVPPNLLPPMPAEIACYVDVVREGAGTP